MIMMIAGGIEIGCYVAILVVCLLSVFELSPSMHYCIEAEMKLIVFAPPTIVIMCAETMLK